MTTISFGEPGPCLDEIVPGAVNFRDLGGYEAAGGRRIRRGLVFRSGMMHGIAAPGLRALEEELGIATVIDLRNETELVEDGVPSFADHGIAHHHVSVLAATAMTPAMVEEITREIIEGRRDWAASYRAMITERGDAYRTMFEILAEPDALPAVFHCSGGRDRTGVGAALVLGLLGVEAEVIAGDYARTGAILARSSDRMRQHAFRRRMAELGVSEEAFTRMTATHPEPMLEFLGWIVADYGSVEALLVSLGVAPESLAALTDSLLEPVPAA